MCGGDGGGGVFAWGGCVWGCICGALQEVDTCAIYAIQCKNSAKTPQASSKKFNQQFCDSVNEN